MMHAHAHSLKLWLTLLVFFGFGRAALEASSSVPELNVQPELAKLVEADWEFQEQQKGRTPSDPAAIRDLLAHAQKLYADLDTSDSVPENFSGFEVFEQKVQGIDQLDEAARRTLYNQLRWKIRELALQNPLVANKPIAFLKRRRFSCQMLHEYLGYFYRGTGLNGGEVCILNHPGIDLSVKQLTAGHMPKGAYTTLALSYDAKRLYFAFAEIPEKKCRTKPLAWNELADKGDAQKAWNKQLKRENSWFHLFTVCTDGSDLRQLTFGHYGDFDPCPLPDGSLAFMSTRRGGYGRCHNWWEPLPVYSLHRLASDDKTISTLSFHETNEWHPSVLPDGRIVYSRWDYVDRSAAHFHGLWLSNPDGTQVASLFGNYTQRVNACYQPKAIPGSNKILFVAGAHHAVVGGSLVVLDPSKVHLNPKSGEDELDSIECLTPEVVFPEVDNKWPSTYYHSPWPLSENYFLVSYSREPLSGMGPGKQWDGRTGLYYFDRFGNLELLYEDPEISCQYPLPLAARPVPREVPSRLDPNLAEQDEAEVVLTDVYQSVLPMPADRKIESLRVFQLLPKGPGFQSNKPRVGYPNAANTRMFLGSVPVEKDGSAYFRVPAKKPLYFQAVDAKGHAVQSMRSEVYFQPGEQRSCIGCHEPPQSIQAAPVLPLAVQRKPSQLQPGPDGSYPMNYVRLVQPVLDKHCISCHSGKGADKADQLDLTSALTKHYNRSYESLKPFVRWLEWGDATIRPINTEPGHCGADESPLLKILADKNHADVAKTMTDEERTRLILWLDATIPFYGTFEEPEMAKQQNGETIEVPNLQ